MHVSTHGNTTSVGVRTWSEVSASLPADSTVVGRRQPNIRLSDACTYTCAVQLPACSSALVHTSQLTLLRGHHGGFVTGLADGDADAVNDGFGAGAQVDAELPPV